MAAEREILYMKGDRDVEVDKTDVVLGDILAFECSNPQVIPQIKALKILELPDRGKQRYVISVLKIIARIHETYPQLEIQNLGETDIIITYGQHKNSGAALHIIKTAVVALLVFAGAAFSIMAFNNDVSITDLFAQIYKLATGTETNGFTVLEAGYSTGITIGILVFFNHFGKKKFTVDPTPLEVQMRLYEKDIQTTLIENAARKGEELDVDQSDPAGVHRT